MSCSFTDLWGREAESLDVSGIAEDQLFRGFVCCFFVCLFCLVWFALKLWVLCWLEGWAAERQTRVDLGNWLSAGWDQLGLELQGFPLQYLLQSLGCWQERCWVWTDPLRSVPDSLVGSVRSSQCSCEHQEQICKDSPHRLGRSWYRCLAVLVQTALAEMLNS